MSDLKRILFIGGNYFPEKIGIGKYNGEMANWLAGQNIDCTVITSYPYYPEWKIDDAYAKRAYWYKKEISPPPDENSQSVKIYRCPQYTPSNPSGLKRMILDFTFSFSALLVIIKLLFTKKFDYVITVVPSFQLGLLAIFYNKFKKGKFVYHVQDLQIDAAKEMGMIKSSKLINLLLKIEIYILKKADIISTISDGMIKKLKLKVDKEVILFPNWVDTSLYYPIKEKDELKHFFKFNKDDKIVLYSGAIGNKQGLEMVLQVAESFKYNPDIKFVISGSGPYQRVLKEKASSLQLENTFFMSLQPTDKFNKFLNMADVHLVTQKINASDLVMPSKLSTILSIGGLAIVTAPTNSSLHRIISENNMSILIEPENHELLSKAIFSTLYSNHQHLKENAYKYSNKYLRKEFILTNYLKYLRGILDQGHAKVKINKQFAS
jgi:colanic acid biosynthesis glycosyl transferase WcaI